MFCLGCCALTKPSFDATVRIRSALKRIPGLECIIVFLGCCQGASALCNVLNTNLSIFFGYNEFVPMAR